jgi:hypothetical protein
MNQEMTILKKGYGFVILLFAFCISFISGCSVKTHYNFMHDVSQINKIQIVEAGSQIIDGELEQKIIGEVTDNTVFLDSFSQLECFINTGDPRGIRNGQKAIKIIYCNGDYELIGKEGQGKYRSGKYKHYAGYRFFDVEQFDELIVGCLQ